jgi:hypothetical protein
MKNISYDFKEGQLIRLFHGVPESAWLISEAPEDVLIECLSWNDSNGDFEGLNRFTLLELLLSEFIVNKG